MENEVNISKNEHGEWVDLDYPDVAWQLLEFDDDRFDCVVCEFPIESGYAFGCLDDYTANAHQWCVTKHSSLSMCANGPSTLAPTGVVSAV